ncbi:MAG: DUF418 domain-containing protein [Algicola sp.]|nr:DUF418 domain-containing protein [Algicola sp.]
MSGNIDTGVGVKVRARPLSAKERVLTLDVLRGFALFGIMFINVYAFFNPDPRAWFSVPWSNIGPAEYSYEVFKIFFVQGKFYTLFAFLFGLGFAVQLASAERRGGSFALRFLWRMVILWLIGAVHLLFIWDGDILHSYAAAGLLLLVCFAIKRLVLDKLVNRFSATRDKAPRWLMLVVAALLVFGPQINFGRVVYQQTQIMKAHEAGQSLTTQQQVIVDRNLKLGDPARAEQHQKSIDKTGVVFKEGSYVDTVNHRITHSSKRLLPGMFWVTLCGIFLVGAYFGRNEFIERAAQLRGGFVKLAIAALVIGVPTSLLFVYAYTAKPADGGIFWFWLTFISKSSSALAFALMYVSIITLSMLTPAKRWLLHLAPVGRMALSNYLIQSIIGTIVFYGFGLGLMSNIGILIQVGFVVVLFSLQIVFSRWWLARFRFGLVEWLWRSLTYLKLQPFRVKISNPAMAEKLV